MVAVVGGGVEVTHEDPFQYCPDGHVPLLAVVAHEVPFQYWPDGQEVDVVEETQVWVASDHVWPDGQVVEEGVVEFTHAVPFQYCPEVQVVEGLDWGALQHPPLYQYQPEDPHFAESKQFAGVLQLEEVVVVPPQSAAQEPVDSPVSHRPL